MRIEDGTTVIGNHSHAGDAGIRSVTLPDSVREIGVGAFAGCAELEKITLNEGLIRAEKGSYAADFAAGHGMKLEIVT